MIEELCALRGAKVRKIVQSCKTAISIFFRRVNNTTEYHDVNNIMNDFRLFHSHHTQMDGAHASKFLEYIQQEIDKIA